MKGSENMKRGVGFWAISIFVTLFLTIMFIKILEAMLNYSIWFMKAFGVVTTVAIVFLFIALILLGMGIRDWWNKRRKK